MDEMAVLKAKMPTQVRQEPQSSHGAWHDWTGVKGSHYGSCPAAGAMDGSPRAVLPTDMMTT